MSRFSSRTLLHVPMAALLIAFAAPAAGAQTGTTTPPTTAQTGTAMPPGITAKTVGDKQALVDSKGMTLYTYQRDSIPGKSACVGQCATNWPALMAADGAAPMGDWTIITRDDGAKMWAYKGKPLYTYARDAKAGDMTGDGAGSGAWKIATP